MVCYNCGITLNRKTRSAEHILPNSIGGKRKGFNLLCKSCNEKFGRTIDNEFASKLAIFYTALKTGGPLLRGQTTTQERFRAALKKSGTFSGSPGYYRAIAKICLNYYLSKGYAKEYGGDVKSFVNGESPNHNVYYYVPDSGSVHERSENEVSHIIHLYGNKASGFLYAYIELFNTQNLVVIFSMEYDGKDIDVTYCLDVKKEEEMVKKINLNVSRAQLEQLGNTAGAMKSRLEPGFERLMRILLPERDFNEDGGRESLSL